MAFDFLKDKYKEAMELKEIKEEAKKQAMKEINIDKYKNEYKQKLIEKEKNKEIEKLNKKFDTNSTSFGEKLGKGFTKIGDKFSGVGNSIINKAKDLENNDNKFKSPIMNLSKLNLEKHTSRFNTKKFK